jgi:hypothetical protein
MATTASTGWLVAALLIACRLIGASAFSVQLPSMKSFSSSDLPACSMNGAVSVLLAPALAASLLAAPVLPVAAQDEAPRTGQVLFDTK